MWDGARLGSNISLSGSNRTVTRKDGEGYGCVLGSSIFQKGMPSSTFALRFDQKDSDRLYVGLAYEDVSLDDSCNSENLVVRGCGDAVEFGNWRKRALPGGFQKGDTLEVMASAHAPPIKCCAVRFFPDQAVSSVSGRYASWTGNLLSQRQGSLQEQGHHPSCSRFRSFRAK
jgi:hypothetical protein